MNVLYRTIGLAIFIMTILPGLSTEAESNGLVLAKEQTSQIFFSNNLFLQGIIVILVVLIFGYAARLLYNRKIEKE